LALLLLLKLKEQSHPVCSITQSLDCDLKVMLKAGKIGQILLFNRGRLKVFAWQ